MAPPSGNWKTRCSRSETAAGPAYLAVQIDPLKICAECADGNTEKHGFVCQRKPTGFKDYDPNAVNTDGSKGNIVPGGDLVFENVPLDQAMIRANVQGKP